MLLLTLQRLHYLQARQTEFKNICVYIQTTCFTPVPLCVGGGKCLQHSDITFIFIAQKSRSVMVNFNLHL